MTDHYVLNQTISYKLIPHILFRVQSAQFQFNASANVHLEGKTYENNCDTITNKALVTVYPQSMDLCSKIEYKMNEFRVVSNENTFINNNIRSFMEIECLNIMFDGMNVSNNNFSVLFSFLINSEWMKVYNSVEQPTFAQNKEYRFITTNNPIFNLNIQILFKATVAKLREHE